MTKPPSPRPLSIKIIALIYVFGALGEFGALKSDSILLGFLVSGTIALVWHLVLGVLLVILAIGLWRLLEPVRRAAIGYELYNLLSFASMGIFNRESTIETQIQELFSQLGATTAGEKTLVMVAFGIGGTLMFLITVGILWFLVKRKSAFVKPATSP